jgi:uncharacterized protein Yka (UPF0111/DUF47 family)
MAIDISVVDDLLKKHCHMADKKDREACAKALQVEFEEYRNKTSRKINSLSQEMDEIETALDEERSTCEYLRNEIEEIEVDADWNQRVALFWELCERK